MRRSNFAEYWSHKLGGSIDEKERLGGGINSLVYLCKSKHNKWVIKGYPLPKRGQRDRMEADVQFLRYAAHVAPGVTPVLMEVDTDRRCTVMEYIQGDTYPEGYNPCQMELEAAFSFIDKLNSNMDLASKMITMDAAEGFLSLRQHMGNVIERLSEMETEHLPDRYQSEARCLLTRLIADADVVNKRLEQKLRSGFVEDMVDRSECCISPSDFGFHNAIRLGKGVKFIDFEFGGWDDPSKLCVDFVLQQRNPICLNALDVASRLFPAREAQMKNRIEALTEVLSLKWQCIIMGILNPVRLTQLVNQQLSLTSKAVIDTQLKRYYAYCARMAKNHNI